MSSRIRHPRAGGGPLEPKKTWIPAGVYPREDGGGNDDRLGTYDEKEF